MGEAKRRRAVAKTVLPNGVRLDVNRPTPEGYHLGAMLAQIADEGEPEIRLRFPDCSPRCASCAFKAGTIPNGCPETVLDAMGCIVEGIQFMCHQRFDGNGNPEDLCSGWLFAMASKRAALLTEALEGKLPFDLPARGPEAQAYLDDQRQRIRAKKAGASP